MILRGILGESLGNFVCVRGFAKLGDIEKVSFSDQSFQRPMNKEHVDDIVAFLNQSQSLFFPEVILSCQLQRTVRGRTNALPIGLLRTELFQPKAFNQNFDGISVRGKVGGKYKSEGDIRSEEYVHVIELDIDDDYWRQQTHPPFFRIDGNHRLTASRENSSFYDYVTPFCLLLFDDYNENNRHSKIIFHNINSKARALTSEENLRVIIDEETNGNENSIFSDDLLKNATYFGWHYYFTRHLLSKINLNAGQFGHLAHLTALRDEPRSTLLMLFDFLLQKGLINKEEVEIDRLFDSLRQVDKYYEDVPKLRHNRSKGLLVAFVYYQLKRPAKLAEIFQKWVLSGHLYDIEEIEAGSLINIFDKIIESRKRTIFVSMEFSSDTDRHYDMIREAIEEINTEFSPDLKIEQVRMDKQIVGHSYQITDEILRLIKDSGFFIADLSRSNMSVYHEVGYLMGLNDGYGIPQENFLLLLKQESNGKTENVGFNLQNWNHIRFSDTNDLKNKIKENIKKYYKLS